MENQIIFGVGIGVVSNVVSDIITRYIDKVYFSRIKKDEFLEKLKKEKANNVIDEMLKEGFITYRELFELKNFAQIAEKADQFRNKNVKSEKNIDIDWILRFFEYAKNITNEEMKNIWAKVLASEIEFPNSIQYSLLHIISIIKPKEAKLFNHIVKFSLRDNKYDMAHPLIFITKNRVAYAKMEINIDDLKGLERLGLIECSFSDEFIFSGKKRLRYGNNELLITGDVNCNNRIQAGNVKYTDDGQSLYNIISEDFKEYDRNILEFVIEKFKNRNCSVIINNNKFV